MIHAAPVKHPGERRRKKKKKLAKDGGGGVAVGNLLNKAPLLGNSSNSTEQWGRGVLQRLHIITRNLRAPKPTPSKEGNSAGLSRMIHRRMRGQVDETHPPLHQIHYIH